MATKNFEEIIFEAFGEEFFRKYTIGLYGIYAVTQESAKAKYDRMYRPFVSGQERFVKANELLRDIGEQYQHIDSRLITPPGCSIPCGVAKANNITITCASIQSPAEIPNKADYRNMLAAKNAQLNLFEDNEPAEIDLSTIEIYAVIGHGSSQKSKNEPEWIRLMVTDNEMKKKIWEVDLVKRFMVVLQGDEQAEVGSALVSAKRKRKTDGE